MPTIDTIRTINTIEPDCHYPNALAAGLQKPKEFKVKPFINLKTQFATLEKHVYQKRLNNEWKSGV